MGSEITPARRSDRSDAAVTAMLGLFDSGLGGLTVVRRVHDLLPAHDLLFFADQAHMPYGSREPDDLAQLLAHNVQWLDAQGVDAIVMACNTTCAIAQTSGWPDARAEILDLIDAAAAAVCGGDYQRIGVVATAATVSSGAYARKIRARNSAVEVIEVAAPKLVPLVEAGQIATDETRAAVSEACAQLPSNLDAVILACTHYPVLDMHFADALGDRIVRIDPACEQAQRTADLVTRAGYKTGNGTVRYVTNGDLAAFEIGVQALMGEFAPHCEKLEDAVL
ncbi:MAG: glutamate racemase [Candidatus Eremiobacteraeota bacterium]|nr:glutamate racemase [Candidatus Eremiobacteraeota bacterium]